MNIFLRDFFNLKIVEESKPSYTMISYALYNIINFIITDFKLSTSNILYILLIFFFCIYLEIITLNFCGLDNNTYCRISQRGKINSIEELVMTPNYSLNSSELS